MEQRSFMEQQVILSCPNCGEKLTISQDVERVTCTRCRSAFIVERGGGITLLVPVMKISVASVDNAAFDQIIKRLEQEVADLKMEIQQISNQESYRKNYSYWIICIGSFLFSVISLISFIKYDVVIWIVFFIAGILITFVSAIAVKQQASEYENQQKVLKERLEPYQRALQRKQEELDARKGIRK